MHSCQLLWKDGKKVGEGGEEMNNWGVCDSLVCQSNKKYKRDSPINLLHTSSLATAYSCFQLCVMLFPALNRASTWRISVRDKSQCLQPNGATVQSCTIFIAICHPILDPSLCPGQNSSICQEVVLTNGSKVHYNMGTYDSNHTFSSLSKFVYFPKLVSF